jgi:hypothetical protein
MAMTGPGGNQSPESKIPNNVAPEPSRDPIGLQDQMTLEAAKEGAGIKIIKSLDDPKFKGMEKWSYTTKSSEGVISEVHYVRDPKTGRLMDFKFKHHAGKGE